MFSKLFLRSGIKKSTLLILVGQTVFSVGIYLLVSTFYFRIGFPLDDAWIHQTYARSFATSGQWAFIPGHISGGSTSPLWTFLLSIGIILHISPLYWTFGLGVMIFWGSALLVEIIIRQCIDSYRTAFPWAGSVVLFEWHLVWASMSGMETLLFSFLVLLIFHLLILEDPGFLVIGLLIGLATWVRPDALLLIGPAFLVGITKKSSMFHGIKNLVKISIGYLIIFIPYLLFSLRVSGSLWPTTFYAKQAEYAAVFDFSIFRHFGNLTLQFGIGIGILLLPGFIILMVKAIKKRRLDFLAILIWLIGMIGLYAWRLPETYQHGRYLIPCMYVFNTFGIIGLVNYLQSKKVGWRWVLEKTWVISTVVVLSCFWAYGAMVYARDVAFIESEMVDTARWIADNIPKNDTIATHDIGAMGYFGDHPIIDLAGLINPEVIPIIGDEIQLKEYLDIRGAKYLVTFPGWYPILIKNLPIIFSTQGEIAPLLGGENLVIYKWIENNQITR